MIVPHADYRLNPSRAVFVVGQIDNALVARLTPLIIGLQAKSRDPITVYIDSPGGSTQALADLLRLLRLSNQDSASPCRIITVATTRAASAAADLLCSGDYATAFPHSTVLHHGISRSSDAPLTLEQTSVLSERLRTENKRFALDLAERIESRFLFRFITMRGEFPGFRAKQGNAGLSELDCFIGLVSDHLSPDALEFWKKARARRGRYENLAAFVIDKIHTHLESNSSVAETEAQTLKAIVDFELEQTRNQPEWSFEDGGLGRTVDDFFLYNEFLTSLSMRRLLKWAKTFQSHLLSAADLKKFARIKDDVKRDRAMLDAVWLSIRPIVSFFLALCHALQEGENYFTATDAYWLGFIDEVIGTDLLSHRNVLEFKEDQVAVNRAPLRKARVRKTIRKTTDLKKAGTKSRLRKLNSRKKKK